MRSAVAVCLVVVSNACAAAPELTIGWTSSSTHSAVARVLMLILEPEFAVVAAAPFNDADSLISAIADGSVDIAVIDQPTAPIPDVHVLVPLFPSVLHIIAHQDIIGEDVTLSDLVNGHSVDAGLPGSASYRLLEDLGRLAVVPPIEKIDLQSPLGALPDVFFVIGGFLEQDSISRMGGYRLVGLDSVSELGRGSWVEGIAMRYLHLEPFIIPNGLYPSLSESPVLTLSVQALLVARGDLTVDTAYRITQLAREHSPTIEAVYPLARHALRAPIEESALNLPVHAGSRRYSARNAPTLVERYAEVLGLAITVVLTTGSMLIAVLRKQKQRKKDRLDAYFDEIVALRQRIGKLDSDKLLKDAHALQKTVTELVVTERVAVDSMLSTFFILSNQVLDEIKAENAR